MTLSTAEFQRIFFGDKAAQEPVDHLQRMHEIWEGVDPNRVTIAFLPGRKRLEGSAARSAVRNAIDHQPTTSTSERPRAQWHRWYGDHRNAALKAMIQAGGRV